VVGGFISLEGICMIGCAPDLGVSLNALTGIAGNHVTARLSPRLAYTFWLGERDTVGIDLAGVGGAMAFLPVGEFAEFCRRVGAARGRGTRHPIAAAHGER
jgi:hypothetical protein